MIVNKTYRLKLKPTKEQVSIFNQWIGGCRFVYNVGMEIKQTTYQKSGKGISKFELMKQLTDAKKEILWLNDIHSQVLQNSLDRLEISYKNFFDKRTKYPKFAKKDKYNSFSYKQGVKLHPNTYSITLPKIGTIKFFKDKMPIGLIKTTTIKKEVDGWYVCLSVAEEHIPQYQDATNAIGIDLGISQFIVTSDGEYIANPKTLNKYEHKLKTIQKSVSRKKKGSNNRKKEVFKLHLKVKRIRHDFQHKISSKLINENQIVYLENLKISNMLKNHKLAKSISDCSWGNFGILMEYKAKWNNKQVVFVAPNNTSKDCGNCGYRMDKMPLNIREWICPECKTKHNRDENAAINVKQKGVGHILSICGETVRPLVIQRQVSVKQRTTDVLTR